MNRKNGWADRFIKWSAHYAKDPDFEVRHIEKNKLDKYAEDFCNVYNAAFAKHGVHLEIVNRVRAHCNANVNWTRSRRGYRVGRNKRQKK